MNFVLLDVISSLDWMSLALRRVDGWGMTFTPFATCSLLLVLSVIDSLDTIEKVLAYVGRNMREVYLSGFFSYTQDRSISLQCDPSKKIGSTFVRIEKYVHIVKEIM